MRFRITNMQFNHDIVENYERRWLYIEIYIPWEIFLSVRNKFYMVCFITARGMFNTQNVRILMSNENHYVSARTKKNRNLVIV